MRAHVLAVLLSCSVAAGQEMPGAALEGPIYSQPSVLIGSLNPYAFFEFAPTSGAGMGTECACADVTGAKGSAISWVRASSATCTKGSYGLRTTGISTGDLVGCGSNLPRVVRASGGELGVMRSRAATNLLLRFIAIDNAAWADVGTPILTGSQAAPWAGTYATSAVLMEDDDAGAFEGRSQNITVTASAAYTLSCYLKAGTATKARISIDGTTQDISGLSATTWSIIEKADASASSTTISVQILVGNAVTDTGTITWGGCQAEAGAYRTAMVPTVSATVTRAIDVGAIDLGAASPLAGNLMSMAASVSGKPATTSDVAPGLLNLASDSMGSSSGKGMWLYSPASSGATMKCIAANNTGTVYTTGVSGASSGNLRGWCAATGNGAPLNGEWPVGTAMSASANLAGTFSPARYLSLGSTGAMDSIISQVCLSPDPSRCR